MFEWKNLRGPLLKIAPAGLFTRPKNPLQNNTRQNSLLIIDALYKKLGELEARPSDIAQSGDHDGYETSTDPVIKINAKIPRGRPLELVVLDIAQCAQAASYRLSDCVSDEKKQSCVLSLDPDRKKGPRISLTIIRTDRYFSSTAQLAVLGEIGADTSYQTIVAFLSIPEPLTISLVPLKKRTTLTAQLAEQYHKEVVIRLPLEPVGKIPEGFAGSVIMVHFSKDLIRMVLSEAKKTVPTFSGFENLWGSRALEDSRVMGIIAEDLKKTGGYFVESRTTKNSVLPRLSESLDFPLSEIGVSVGENAKQAGIEKQLRQCAATAQANGSMIMAVPVTAQSVAALKASMPWLKQNGIRLANVSEIAPGRKK